MNIIMISSDRALAAGKRGAFFNTLEEFSKHWDRIDIICPRPAVLNQNNYFRNVFIHPSPWPLIFQSFWIYKKGLEIIKKNKVDVMTVHDYPPFYNGLGARLLYNRVKIPYMEEIFHIVGYPRSANIKEYIYKMITFLLIRFASSKAKKIRVMNQTQVPEFLKSSGIKMEKIDYIPAIYLDRAVYKNLGLVKDYDVIFIGRLVNNKGINIFLESVRRIQAKAIIVGEGPLKERLKQKIHDWGISDRVTFYGWAKDDHEIATLLNKSRVLVMTSYNEGGPRVIIEAMACGVPVLGTPVGITPDIIKSGSSGEIIDWEPKNISQKIFELLSNADKIKAYSLAGLKIAEQFDKEKSIKNYADKLKSLII